jgi:3',5'-cyclic AMP phosphodiesterase CpdA
VAVVSDLNGAYGSTEYAEAITSAVERILEIDPALVLCTGDMVAGQKEGTDTAAMWEAFHRTVTDRLDKEAIPFAVTPGNHDASTGQRYSGEREAFVAQWSARRPRVDFVDDDAYPLRYAFTFGGALFVALDAVRPGRLSQEQLRWLETVFEGTPGRAHTVAFGHLPLHPIAQGRESEVLADVRLERLLIDRGADLYISGHHHAYFPGRRGALRLLGVGCLGPGARRLIGAEQRSPRSFAELRFQRGGGIGIEAYAGERFTRRIDRAELPRGLGEGSGAVVRDDLER